jgi:hypothetical protein
MHAQADASVARICARCGESLADQTALPAAAHLDALPEGRLCRAGGVSGRSSLSDAPDATARCHTSEASIDTHARSLETSCSPWQLFSGQEGAYEKMQNGAAEAALDDLRQRHAAEVASMQRAFHARTNALQEDLQVHSVLITFQKHPNDFASSKNVRLQNLYLTFLLIACMHVCLQGRTVPSRCRHARAVPLVGY